jgi:hypothetical protein
VRVTRPPHFELKAPASGHLTPRYRPPCIALYRSLCYRPPYTPGGGNTPAPLGMGSLGAGRYRLVVSSPLSRYTTHQARPTPARGSIGFEVDLVGSEQSAHGAFEPGLVNADLLRFVLLGK